MLDDTLDLLDWKRRVFELYAQVRAAGDPESAWAHWREARDSLFRSHPQSPVPAAGRGAFAPLEYYPYDRDLRFLAEVEAVDPQALEIAGSAGSLVRFTRFAVARLDGAELELYWLDGYGGGVFLPFGDATNGGETYGAGRYLLDSVKGADLGASGRRLVLDFNFAYNPSCAYDPRWACPLSPPANRLVRTIRAGERIPTR
jgi:uncharacterized protein (DUF1684 family)